MDAKTPPQGVTIARDLTIGALKRNSVVSARCLAARRYVSAYIHRPVAVVLSSRSMSSAISLPKVSLRANPEDT